jgi:MoxR-like ATPase
VVDHLEVEETGMTQTADRLRKIVTELSDQFYERSAVVRAMAVAVLAGQHSLLLGPPGTAKSELARALTGRSKLGGNDLSRLS